MSLSAQNQNSGEPNHAPLTFTLEPLRTFGPEPPYALDVPGIDTVLPSEVLLRWENDEYDTELLTSTTLFAHPFDEIPAGARLIKASFAVATAKDHEPKSVTITPPTLLETDSPQLLEPFLAWATKRGLATVQAAHLAIAILIDTDAIPIMQQARRTRLQAAKSGFDMGIPFNELNKIFDLGFKPIVGGDTGYINSNLVPLRP